MESKEKQRKARKSKEKQGKARTIEEKQAKARTSRHELVSEGSVVIESFQANDALYRSSS